MENHLSDHFRFFRFLEEVLPKEAERQQLFFFMAYSMTNRSDMGKGIIICGPPRSGKSVLYRFLCELWNIDPSAVQKLEINGKSWEIANYVKLKRGYITLELTQVPDYKVDSELLTKLIEEKDTIRTMLEAQIPYMVCFKNKYKISR